MLRELVERAQAGDLTAFDALVQEFQDAVFGSAYAILGDRDDAEDAAQQAFIDAWQDVSALRDPDRFPGWLHRIAQNRCRDLLRRPQRRSPGGEAFPGRAEAIDPALEASRRQVRERVLAAIRSLSEANRLATTLFYIDGYSIKEVAEFLEAPVGTVKRRLHDARRRLQRSMMDMVPETLDAEKPGPELRARIAAELEARKARSDEMLRRVRSEDQVEWARRWHEERMEDVRANAAQYGIEPDESLPRMSPEYRRGTFRDDAKDLPRRWGIPEGLEITNLRDLCRELLVSPLSIHRWEAQALPALRYRPWVLYDRARVRLWLGAEPREPVLAMTAEQARRPFLTVLATVSAGLAGPEEAAEVCDKLETARLVAGADPVSEPEWEATRDRERRENAAQYGLDEPTDNWLGIPQDRIPHQFEIRDLTRRLGVSPIDVVRWTRDGMPCLRHSPYRRWDADRVTEWLAAQRIPPTHFTIQELENTALFICRAVASGQATPDEAHEALAGWGGVM